MKSAAVAVAPSAFPTPELMLRRPPGIWKEDGADEGIRATWSSSLARAAAIPGVRPATALEIRPAPEMVAFGIAALDELTGGVPRGALTEMVGPASSGRASVMMSLMAIVTRRQEVCAVVDASDGFDPASAASAGVDLQRTLWVRCGKTAAEEERGHLHSAAMAAGGSETARAKNETAAINKVTINKVAPPAKNISWSITTDYDRRLRHAMRGEEDFGSRRGQTLTVHGPASFRKTEKQIVRPPQSFAEMRRAKWDRLDQALKATDLLLQSGGFGLVIVDLGDVSAEQARRIPLTSWFRFRRVVENTPTILLVVAKESCAKTCASLVMQLSAEPVKSGQPPYTRLSHVSLLDGLDVQVELVRTRLERKPVRSVRAQLKTETAWRKQG